MMKATISADGRIMLPKKLLISLGIRGATKVFITTKGSDIILKDCVKVCALCSGEDNMIEGFPVCRECAEKISDLLKLI